MSVLVSLWNHNQADRRDEALGCLYRPKFRIFLCLCLQLPGNWFYLPWLLLWWWRMMFQQLGKHLLPVWICRKILKWSFKGDLSGIICDLHVASVCLSEGGLSLCVVVKPFFLFRLNSANSLLLRFVSCLYSESLFLSLHLLKSGRRSTA